MAANVVMRYSKAIGSATLRTASCNGEEVAIGGGGNGDNGTFPSTDIGEELVTGQVARSWSTSNKTAKAGLRAWVICSR